MARGEQPSEVTPKEHIANASVDELLTSLTAKGIIYTLARQTSPSEPNIAVVYDGNIQIARALDPLQDASFTAVLSGVWSRLGTMSPKELDQVARASTGILGRIDITKPLPKKFMRSLAGLGRQARLKLQKLEQ